MVLAVHNRERAAVGVPPLVWSDKLAADAKPYAEHLLTTAELEHPSQEWVDAHPNSVPGYEGENLAWREQHDDGTDSADAAGLDLGKEQLSRRTRGF